METRKNFADFILLPIHHVITLSLLVVGVSMECYDISIMVSQIHDVADVVLEVCKLFRYFKRITATKVCSVVFCLSWIYTRCIVFPLYVIFPFYNGKVDSVLKSLNPSGDTVYPVLARTYGPPLMFGLFVLNLIWTVFVIKITFNAVFRADFRDVRDDSEEKESGKESGSPVSDSSKDISPKTD